MTSPTASARPRSCSPRCRAAPRRLRRLPGHAAHLPGRAGRADRRRPTALARQAAGHRHRGDRAGTHGRRERLLRHQAHGQEVPARDRVGSRDAARLTSAVHPSAAAGALPRATRPSGPTASVRERVEARSRRPASRNAPSRRRHRRRRPVHRQQRHTPATRCCSRDDKGLQPADNPVLVLRESMATPETLRVANKVSAAITTGVYNAMSLAVSREQRDPTEVAARFLAEHSLPLPRGGAPSPPSAPPDRRRPP